MLIIAKAVFVAAIFLAAIFGGAVSAKKLDVNASWAMKLGLLLSILLFVLALLGGWVEGILVATFFGAFAAGYLSQKPAPREEDEDEDKAEVKAEGDKGEAK